MALSPVRYAADGFELLCGVCKEYQPLDLEHWHPKYGMSRCHSCWRDYFAVKKRRVYNTSDQVREIAREKARVRYWANHEQYLETARRYRAAHHEERKAASRRDYEKHREARLAYHARYQRENRAVINLKRREGRPAA